MNFFRNRKSPKAIQESIKKSITEPFIPEFTDYTQKIRRNSLLISTASLIITIGGVGISNDYSIGGLKLTGVDDTLLKKMLLIFNIYWLMHFCWCAADYFLEWRIRLTSHTHNPYSWGATEDLTSKGRNNNIYRWIFFSQEPAIHFKHELEDLKKMLSGKLSPEETKRVTENIDNGIMALQNCSGTEENRINTLADKLNRFDSWWQLMRTSASIRWITIELCLPILLGVPACFYLFKSIYPSAFDFSFGNFIKFLC